jgi:hypothetical protein
MLNFMTRLVVCGTISLVVGLASGNAVVAVVAAGVALWWMTGE